MIALTETPNLDRNNHEHFTNLLTLVEINKIILKGVKYRQSKFHAPSFEKRQEMFLELTNYWNFVIDTITIYSEFFSGKTDLSLLRNSEKGKPLNLLFVPIGQKFLSELYFECIKMKKRDQFIEKINLLNFDLIEGHFSNLFYSPVKNVMIMNNYKVAKEYALYLMGLVDGDLKLKTKLCKAYGINELSEEFKKFILIDPV